MRLLWLILLVPLHVRAALIEVASTNLVDVQLAITNASNGDVVRFPFEGVFDFGTTTIEINKRIAFVGWHQDTTIFSRVASSANRMFWFRNVPITDTNLCVFSHFTVNKGPGTTTGMIGVGGTSGQSRTNKNWRIHHVSATEIGKDGRGIQVIGTQEGLIDNYYFDWLTDQTQQGLSMGFPNYVEQAVGAASSYEYALGTLTNFVYVQYCSSSPNFSGDSTLEMYGTSRVVMRFNNWTNSTFFGIHENGDNRSPCILEAYGNTWHLEAGQIAQRPNDWRSGWGIICSNVLTSDVASSPDTLLLSAYRSSGTNIAFPSGATYYSYTTVKTAPSPADTGTTLTINFPNRIQTVPYQSTLSLAVRIWPGGVDWTPANSELATVTAHDQLTGNMTLTRGSPARSVLVGDSFSLQVISAVTGTNRLDRNLNVSTSELGYPMLDQPGWGDPTAWTTTNSTQTLHGVYEWENTFNGANMSFSLHNFCNGGPDCNAGLTGAGGFQIADTPDLVQSGRDYFEDTAKPGYTPYGAHPLATAAEITPASTNVANGVTVAFAATGTGGTPLIWEFYQNQSGGTINSSTGEYVSGNIGNTDVIRYLDPHGNYGYATITVEGVGPPSPSVPPGFTRSFNRKRI